MKESAMAASGPLESAERMEDSTSELMVKVVVVVGGGWRCCLLHPPRETPRFPPRGKNLSVRQPSCCSIANFPRE